LSHSFSRQETWCARDEIPEVERHNFATQKVDRRGTGHLIRTGR
jgi:hypothetical protein